MRSAAVLDANVLVCAIDPSAGARHERAVSLLARRDDLEFVLTTQVISEYANVATHPRKLGMSADVVAPSVRRLAELHRVLQVTPETVTRALEGRARWQLAYYDAQIWASAALAGVPTVLSEDFADGLTLGPVRFRNPFTEGFDAAAL